MHPSYLDEAKVRRYFERSADVFGVTDTNGALRAYICVRICGEVACVERILGHADALKSGSDVGACHRDDPGTRGAENRLRVVRRGSCTTRISGHRPACDNSSIGPASSRTESRGLGGVRDFFSLQTGEIVWLRTASTLDRR